MKIYSYIKEAFPENNWEINIEIVRECNVNISGISIPNNWEIKQKQQYIQTELDFHYKRIGKEYIDNLHIKKGENMLSSKTFTIICDVLHKVYYVDIKEEHLAKFMQNLKEHFSIGYKKDYLFNKKEFWIF